MEPGKGADCLLAPSRKAASARGILALAAALVLLALAGCGGDEGSSGDGAESASADQAAAATPSIPEDASAESGANKEAAGEASSNPDAAKGGGGGKQGPQISLPEGSPEPGITAEQREKAKLASISLDSPAVLPVANGPAELPAAYTCEGKDSWPALRWQGVPEGTQELVLFAMALAPVEGKLFFDWAVAGIDPELEGLEAGRLPKGAVSGENSFGRRGYSICPPEGQSETYFFALYALPERLGARAGFDPRALRRQVQELSRNVGILPVTYARG